MTDYDDGIPVEDPPEGYDDFDTPAPTAQEPPAGAEKVWAAFGRTEPRGGAERSVGDMIQDLYGTNSRGNPNAKEAAKHLGVSERSVQRWIKDGAPKGKGEKLQAAHAAWKRSPQGRKGMNSRREKRIRKHGTTVKFKGTIQISSDKRNRAISHFLSGDQCAAILDAAQRGDDAAAQEALAQALGEYMGGSVDLEIESLETHG